MDKKLMKYLLRANRSIYALLCIKPAEQLEKIQGGVAEADDEPVHHAMKCVGIDKGGHVPPSVYSSPGNQKTA